MTVQCPNATSNALISFDLFSFRSRSGHNWHNPAVGGQLSEEKIGNATFTVLEEVNLSCVDPRPCTLLVPGSDLMSVM